MTNAPYIQGQLLAAAQAVVLCYDALSLQAGCDAPNDAVVEALSNMLERLAEEMIRVANNTINFRNEWGDPVQLATFIIFMSEGYVPTFRNR